MAKKRKERKERKERKVKEKQREKRKEKREKGRRSARQQGRRRERVHSSKERERKSPASHHGQPLATVAVVGKNPVSSRSPFFVKFSFLNLKTVLKTDFKHL